MKIRKVALLATLLLIPQLAEAQAVVTEIMYDPPGTDSGHEWIEVYNTSSSPIPLTAWHVFESGANHNILAASGDTSLAPQSFAVIAQNAAKFQADHPAFSGELFHSAFSLDNAGATIALKDASGTVIESASYDSAQGALGDGNSLQRPPDDTTQFSPHTPTPGMALSTSIVPAKIKQSTTTKAVSSKKTVAHPIASPGVAHAVAPTPASAPQTAAAAAPSGDEWPWLASVFILALLASAALVIARHFKKQEWDIVEETSEDV